MQIALGRGFVAECFAPTLNENSPQARKVGPLLPLLSPQRAVEEPMPGAVARAFRGTIVIEIEYPPAQHAQAKVETADAPRTTPLGRLKMGLLHVLRHAPAAPPSTRKRSAAPASWRDRGDGRRRPGSPHR